MSRPYICRYRSLREWLIAELRGNNPPRGLRSPSKTRSGIDRFGTFSRGVIFLRLFNDGLSRGESTDAQLAIASRIIVVSHGLRRNQSREPTQARDSTQKTGLAVTKLPEDGGETDGPSRGSRVFREIDAETRIGCASGIAKFAESCAPWRQQNRAASITRGTIHHSRAHARGAPSG